MIQLLFKSPYKKLEPLLATLLIMCGLSSTISSQEIEKTYLIGGLVVNSKDEASPDAFYEVIVEEIIFDQINAALEKRGFEIKQHRQLPQLQPSGRPLRFLQLRGLTVPYSWE
jgi:hypothetical protein